jgi:hypothetical protein
MDFGKKLSLKDARELPIGELPNGEKWRHYHIEFVKNKQVMFFYNAELGIRSKKMPN